MISKHHSYARIKKHIISTVLVICFCVAGFPQQVAAQGDAGWHQIGVLGHGTINQIALSPDGQTLITGGSAGISLYSVPDLKPLGQLPGITDEVTSLALSPDGQVLVTTERQYYEPAIHLWDMATRTQIATIDGYEDGYFSNVALSPDGKQVAASYSSDTIYVWNVDSLEETAKIVAEGTSSYGDARRFTTIAFSPDSHNLIYADYLSRADANLHVFDMETQVDSIFAENLYGSITHIVFSPDGNAMITAGDDYRTSLWRIDDLTTAPMQIDTYYTTVGDLAFSPDGQTLIAGLYESEGMNLGSESDVALITRETGTYITTMGNHPTYVVGVKITPDGKTLVSASEDGIIKVWDMETQTEIAHTDENVIGVVSAAFSPDSQKLAVASEYSNLSLWDLQTLEPTILEDTSDGHGMYSPHVADVAFSPDGSILAMTDGQITLWDAVSGELVDDHSIHCDTYVESVSFSLDGQTLHLYGGSFMGGGDAICYWDVATLTEITLWYYPDNFLSEEESHVTNILTALDNGIVAYAAPDGIFIEDTEGGYITGHLTVGSSKDVQDMAFTPDNQSLVVILNDGSLHLWDFTTDETTSMEPGYTTGQFRFSPDGQKMAVLSGDSQSIAMWNLAAHKEESTLKIATGDGVTPHIDYFRFSPDGVTLVADDNQNTIHFWDMNTNEEVATINTNDTIQRIIFLPDSQSMMVVGDISTQIWDRKTYTWITAIPIADNDINWTLFSPDGQTMAVVISGGVIQMWNLRTFEATGTLTGHIGGLQDVIFSPDSRYLATLGYDGTIRLWSQGD